MLCFAVVGLFVYLLVSMWSCGAILAELVAGEPLFPASNEAECLTMMAQLLGTPTEDIWPVGCTQRTSGRWAGTGLVRTVWHGVGLERQELGWHAS